VVSSISPAVLERRLSVERFAPYRAAAGGDPARAVALYEWDAIVGAAFWAALGHVEVVVRNAMHEQLTAWSTTRCGQPLWYLDPGRALTQQARDDIAVARQRATRNGPDRDARSGRRRAGVGLLALPVGGALRAGAVAALPPLGVSAAAVTRYAPRRPRPPRPAARSAQPHRPSRADPQPAARGAARDGDDRRSMGLCRHGRMDRRVQRGHGACQRAPIATASRAETGGFPARSKGDEIGPVGPVNAPSSWRCAAASGWPTSHAPARRGR
jgi:hypothetical protein